MLRVLIAVLVVNHVWCEKVTVVTSRGPVVGQSANDGDYVYTTFYGIPYAKVNEENPFGNAIEYPEFDTEFDASDSTIKCPQRKSNVPIGTLQCLRLNILVPNTADTNNTVPVFVWFHGGGFWFGTGADYDGKHLIKEDIIVVTVNYRLGPYGFLCLDDPEVPGNQGLKDQIAALRWVKENIGAFGGDAGKVTIFGESSGGGAVDLHLYSGFETLFDKAIVQSGSAFVQGMFIRADHEAAIKLAKALGHYTSSTKDALKFLSARDHLEIMGVFDNLSLPLAPCREKRFKGIKNFIKDDPFHLHDLKPVKILIGYTSKEFFSAYATKPDKYFDKLGSLFFDLLKINYDFKHDKLERLAKIVQRFYLGSKPISKDTMLEIIDFISDIKMNRGVEMAVNKYLKCGAKEVYKYLFSYIGGNQYANITGAGAPHTEELDYLFDRKPLVTAEQKLVRERMVKMWSNFVKYGNPTPDTEDLVQWEPVTPDNDTRPYLNIDAEMKMMDSVYKERMSFWDLFDIAYWDHSLLIRGRKH